MARYLSRPDRDYKEGLASLKIPYEDIERISIKLRDEQLPKDVLDTIIENEDRVSKLHPDRYPWHSHNIDILADGLEDQGINCEAVWRNSESYVKRKFQRNMPVLCGIDMGFAIAITNLFEMYALAKYHDVKQLSRIIR